ncbi:hypothetical protein HK096_008201, partial [Nowakowskiella sp. JEL0078]
SPQQIEKFKKCSIAKDMKPLRPIVDVSTRWNSTYDMLSRSVQKFHVLENSKSIWCELILTDDEWSHVNDILSFLGKFFGKLKDATLYIDGSSYVTLKEASYIYEFMQSELLEAVEKFSNDTGLVLGLDKLQSIMTKIALPRTL